MVDKKLYLSQKEYLDIYTRLTSVRQKHLNEKIINAMFENSDIGDFGAIFLEYLNGFRSDKEKMVALIDIFFLGAHIQEARKNMEEGAKKEFADLFDTWNKKGGPPRS